MIRASRSAAVYGESQWLLPASIKQLLYERHSVSALIMAKVFYSAIVRNVSPSKVRYITFHLPWLSRSQPTRPGWWQADWSTLTSSHWIADSWPWGSLIKKSRSITTENSPEKSSWHFQTMTGPSMRDIQAVLHEDPHVDSNSKRLAMVSTRFFSTMTSAPLSLVFCDFRLEIIHCVLWARSYALNVSFMAWNQEQDIMYGITGQNDWLSRWN